MQGRVSPWLPISGIPRTSLFCSLVSRKPPFPSKCFGGPWACWVSCFHLIFGLWEVLSQFINLFANWGKIFYLAVLFFVGGSGRSTFWMRNSPLFLTADTVGTKFCAGFCGLWTIIACLKKPSKLGGLIYNLEMNLQCMLWLFMGISGSHLSHCHWAHPFFLSLPLCRLLSGHGYVTVWVFVRETFSVLEQDKLSNQVIIYFSPGNLLF